MKSSITQIERRFDIPSSLIGVIDGSFEMGMCRLWMLKLQCFQLHHGILNNENVENVEK